MGQGQASYGVRECVTGSADVVLVIRTMGIGIYAAWTACILGWDGHFLPFVHNYMVLILMVLDALDFFTVREDLKWILKSRNVLDHFDVRSRHPSDCWS
jgi:hypothetical protein